MIAKAPLGNRACTEVRIVEITRDLRDWEFNQLMGYLDDAQQRQILRFRFRADQQRSLCANILSRIAICSGLGIENGSVIFRRDAFGKPYAENIDLHFNISHSAQWVACAVSTKPVGIDIQAFGPVHPNLAERFFTRDESDYLRSLPEEERQPAFYTLWTLKESYIKADGRGLSIPLDSLRFDISRKNRILAEPAGMARDYSFAVVFLSGSCICSLCYCTPRRNRLENRDIDWLLASAGDVLAGKNARG